jgi:hypothetical protein
MSEYSIFKPKSKRGLFLDYPELRKVPAFTNLSPDEMLFVWYYACESSPFVDLTTERTRIEESLNISMLRGGKKMSKDQKDRLLEGEFSAKVTTAIDHMQKYRVGPRIRAKMMVEKGFENLEKILNIDASNNSLFLNKEGEVDFAKKKSYVDTMAKATDILPKVIEQLEGGFNIKKDKAGEDEAFKGQKLIEDYHDNKN